MRKKRNLLIVATLLFLSCGTEGKAVCVFPNSPMPLSREAQFVESTSTSEAIVLAKGKGCNVEQAKLDAERAAIWFLLYSGDHPILKTRSERARASEVVRQILAHPSVYIRWVSEPKGKAIEGGYVVMTYLFKVDVASIKQRLIDEGVIQSTEEVAEEVGLPFIAVLPTQNDKLAKFAATVIEEYLQDRDYEVYVPEGNEKINKIVKKVAMLEGKADPYYMEALQVGSDVFVKVSVDVRKVYKYGNVFYKAAVSGKAYETATGKLLAASTGYSPQRNVISPEAVVQEATDDLADKITFQIKKSWLREAKRGKPFKIVLIAPQAQFQNADEAFYMALRRLSRRPIKRLASGQSLATYVAYVKGVPNAFELYLKLKNTYEGPGRLEKVMDSGSFLIVKLAGLGGEVEIE